MGTAKRTLSIIAITTALVGCSAPAPPASLPVTPVEAIHIYATSATFPLVVNITSEYIEDTRSEVWFNTQYASYSMIVSEIMTQTQNSGFVITNHLPLEDNLWAAPIAKDGILIFTAADVDVTGLNIDEIRAIYQGRVAAWSDLGGTDQQIIPYTREPDSDIKLEFDRMVMGNRSLTANARVVTSSQQMIERIASTPGAIGYIAFSERNMFPQANVLIIDGIRPSTYTIAYDIYPLRSTVFVVGLNEPSTTYRKFIGWIQSPRGQSIIAQDYVSLITPERPSADN